MCTYIYPIIFNRMVKSSSFLKYDFNLYASVFQKSSPQWPATVIESVNMLVLSCNIFYFTLKCTFVWVTENVPTHSLSRVKCIHNNFLLNKYCFSYSSSYATILLPTGLWTGFEGRLINTISKLIRLSIDIDLSFQEHCLIIK